MPCARNAATSANVPFPNQRPTGWCYGARWSYPLHVLVFLVTAHLGGVRAITAS